MNRWTFAAAAAVMFLSLSPGEATAQDLSKASVKELVELLASKNPKPQEPDDRGDRPPLPAGYDRKKQDIVYQAWGELVGRPAPELLPVLIDHLDDPRYSGTHDRMGFAWRNDSVGYVCREIIGSFLEQYKSIRALRGDWRDPEIPRFLRDHLNDKKAAEKWYETRKEKSWRELQIETFEYCLEVDRRRGLRTKRDVLGNAEVRKALEELKAAKTHLPVGPPRVDERF